MKKRLIFILMICSIFMLSVVGCNQVSGEETAVAEPVSEAEQETVAEISTSEETAVQTESVTPAVEEVFVSRTDGRVVTNTISADIKKMAEQMEEVSYQDLPDWYGTSPNSKYEFGWTCEGVLPYFTEVTFDEIANEGFNFIRVPLDTRIFFDEDGTGSAGTFFGGNSDNANLNELKNLDDMISWCVERDIHVCLDVHNTPGGYMIGGDEETSRELLFTEGSKEEQIFFDFWDMISARYADVSTNALSFNLYNEPPRFLEEEQYVRFIKRGIEVVHGHSPERLIFADMLDYAHVPVEGLAGEPVVQTFHFYEPTSFTHANFDLFSGTNRNDPILMSYPLPAISCGLYPENSYTINGNFPAKTTFCMCLGMGNLGGKLTIKADGEAVYTQEITKDLVESAGLDVIVDEYGTAMFNCYEAGEEEMRLVYSLEKDAEKVEFFYNHENPDLQWLELNNLIVETPNYRAILAAQWIEGVDLPPTNAVIDEYGRVTLKEDLTEYEQGYQMIRDTLEVYHEFSERTGVQVMLQEFGVMSTNDVRCTAEYFDDILTVCDEYDFSWSMWNYDGGDFSYVVLDDVFRRPVATYEEVNEGRYIPLELREVFRKHMK